MPCLPEPSVAERADLWRAAPALMQQVRRCHLEACGGRRAKRALFGQPDREETRRFVKEELAAIRAADQQKYNFDFSNMRPLAGPYEWQPVVAGEVSAAYQLGRLQSGLLQHRSARRLDFDTPRPATPPEASRCGAASPTEASQPAASPAGPIRAAAPSEAEQRRPASPPEPAAVSTSASPLSEVLARRASPPQPRPAAAASRQTSITDFWRNRKRPSAFSSCGDSAAKRPNVPAAAAAATAADGGSASPQPTPAPAGGASTSV